MDFHSRAETHLPHEYAVPGAIDGGRDRPGRHVAGESARLVRGLPVEHAAPHAALAEAAVRAAPERKLV